MAHTRIDVYEAAAEVAALGYCTDTYHLYYYFWHRAKLYKSYTVFESIALSLLMTMLAVVPNQRKFAIVLLVLQVLLIILFALFARYGPGANPLSKEDNDDPLNKSYAMFTDIHIMVRLLHRGTNVYL